MFAPHGDRLMLAGAFHQLWAATHVISFSRVANLRRLRPACVRWAGRRASPWPIASVRSWISSPVRSWRGNSVYPQPWTIAALPSPLDQWEGAIVGSLFVGKAGAWIIGGLRK